MPPTALGRDERELEEGRIADGDSVIFFNFRGDRPRELIKAITLDDEDDMEKY